MKATPWVSFQLGLGLEGRACRQGLAFPSARTAVGPGKQRGEVQKLPAARHPKMESEWSWHPHHSSAEVAGLAGVVAVGSSCLPSFSPIFGIALPPTVIARFMMAPGPVASVSTSQVAGKGKERKSNT